MRRLGYNKCFISLSLVLAFAFLSCSKIVQKETEVYFNDFETGDLRGITNGYFYEYNGSTVLGRYNQNGFELMVADLPSHDLIQISFDLLIHDSWDGNKLGPDGVDGPDVWQMSIDKELYISTTFSNVACTSADGMFCPPQSYSANYPNNNNYPRKGAYKVDLPAACHPNGTTTWYKITKTISHSKSEVLLQCVDKLIQKNADDPNCDESWSVDNLKVSVIKLD